MLKVGAIVPERSVDNNEVIDYYIVSEKVGNKPYLELLEDYIMRNFTVLYNNERCTLREVLESEKRKIIEEYENNVQSN
jgi:hypothetical protein